MVLQANVCIFVLKKYKYDTRRDSTQLPARARHTFQQLQPSRGKDHRGGQAVVEGRRERALQEHIPAQPQGQPPLSCGLRMS